MKLSTKIKTFFQNLWNSWPTNEPEQCECYLTVSSPGGPTIDVDFNFTLDSSPMLANLLFQLESGSLTGTIVDVISQRCSSEDKDAEFRVFMETLHDLSVVTDELMKIQVTEPVIKPSQVFKYTAEQPKLN